MVLTAEFNFHFFHQGMVLVEVQSSSTEQCRVRYFR